jgi:LPXTG-site transpeptidase (sortase) family protein
MFSSWNLRRINNLLLAAIILVNLYIILAPFTPSIVFWWQKHHTARATQLTELLQSKPSSSSKATNKAAVPVQNSVVIPSMLLNTPILEGTIRNEYKTLDQGVWRWPDGSTPDKGGNTILVGHRFTYTNPRGIFYELNKVAIGDQIGVFWSGKEYLYTVVSTSVISPSQTDILNQTTQSEITLYTCTPTWDPISRLVIVANLNSTGSSVTK